MAKMMIMVRYISVYWPSSSSVSVAVVGAEVGAAVCEEIGYMMHCSKRNSKERRDRL